MDMQAKLMQLLAEALCKQQHSLPARAQEQLVQFVLLLGKWNKVYNLTAIRDVQEMLYVHILDSLALLPFLQKPQALQNGRNIRHVLDVGTGGGIPGIPLAICLPEIDFVLLDARGKKIRFIQTVIAQLGLSNVQAVHARVEQYRRDEPDKFDRIVSRAFASLADMLGLCQHLCDQHGAFLAMKGQIPEQEIAQLPEGFRIDAINALEVSGLDAQRHLIQIVFA